VAHHPVKLGVLGGSGLYEMDGVETVQEHKVSTPFGNPSDAILETKIEDRTVFFLPRHGKGHTLLPSEVNYRANIYALKSLGVTHVLAVSAVGIMEEKIGRGEIVIPDQIFDRTNHTRASTFFGEGIVGHVAFADPFCNQFSSLIADNAKNHASKVHHGGAYVCIEGPQFSTRAESKFYRDTLKPAIIGMTGIPEAKLAREAELCYGMMALTTDFDCWKEDEDVDVTDILRILKQNVELSKKVVKDVAKHLPKEANHGCQSAAQYAIITNQTAIPQAKKQQLALLYGKYLG
jgi:5'-methylthioadenosine phosphorylase